MKIESKLPRQGDLIGNHADQRGDIRIRRFAGHSHRLFDLQAMSMTVLEARLRTSHTTRERSNDIPEHWRKRHSFCWSTRQAPTTLSRARHDGGLGEREAKEGRTERRGQRTDAPLTRRGPQ